MSKPLTPEERAAYRALARAARRLREAQERAARQSEIERTRQNNSRKQGGSGNG